MRLVAVQYAGVLAQTYFLDRGEKISKHWHQIAHTTTTVQGETEVEVFDGRAKFRVGLGHTEELPALIPHEIVALIDGTIVVNLSPEVIQTSEGPVPTRGGVLLHDGTIVPPRF